jgi:predicted RNA methylase
MDFTKLPSRCYINKKKQFEPYTPETDVKMQKFNLNLWRKKFPTELFIDNKTMQKNLSKLQLTNIGVYSIATPAISKSLLEFVIQLCKTSNIDLDNLVVTETNGGLGGFSLRMAFHFKKINIVEINPQHAAIIENNLSVFGADANTDIKIYIDDYLNIMDTLKSDVIICDPPWGGYEYSKQKSMKLGMDGINIVCVINEIIKKKLTKIFILMTPKNYDICDFVQSVILPTGSNIIIHKLDKHYLIGLHLFYVD